MSYVRSENSETCQEGWRGRGKGEQSMLRRPEVHVHIYNTWKLAHMGDNETNKTVSQCTNFSILT